MAEAVLTAVTSGTAAAQINVEAAWSEALSVIDGLARS
jgi:hypothetical protein